MPVRQNGKRLPGDFFFATFVGRTLVRKLAARRGFRNLDPVGAAQIREGLES